MPCYRCGARQVDPDRGPSPWKRGVRADRQVLICPQCQSGRDWAADLDRCRSCGTAHLVRRLGEVECRDCGQVREPGEAQAPDGPAAPDEPAADRPADAAGPAGLTAGEGTAAGDSATELAEDVARALDRVLGPHRVSS